MSAPVSSAYNYAMQEFCETVYTTSDQHKDASVPRMARDKYDLAKLAAKLRLVPGQLPTFASSSPIVCSFLNISIIQISLTPVLVKSVFSSAFSFL